MIGIYFIYGLAFFILGFSILIYPKKRTKLQIANNLWLIAAFGISHGLNEWIDMFSLIQSPFNAAYLKVIGLFLLPVSFNFLVLFGVRTLVETAKRHVWLKMLPLLLPMAWAVIAATSNDRYLIGDIMARYLLGIPGTILTSLALFSLLPELEKTKSTVLIGYQKLAAGAFFSYGLFSGLIVENADFFPASFLNYSLFTDLAGVPVQIARTLCAALASFGIIRVLAVFGWEANKALRDSEERYRTLAETAHDAIFVIDREYMVEYVNEYGAALFGRNPEDIIGNPLETLFPEAANAQRGRLREVLENGMPSYSEEKIPFPKCDRWLSTRLVPLRNESGDVTAVLGISRDITEQKKIERHLRQAQKMEAVGQLAGGIAHDFNNILTVIRGYGSLLKMKLKADDPSRLNVEHILESSDRAVTLTQGLLAFSRQQIIDMSPVNLNNIVRQMERFLNRIIGEDISLNIKLHAGEIGILADRGQIEQVLMNLATNARDAMPSGGPLHIATSIFELDEGFIEHHGYGKVGNYALLSVTDGGCGMDNMTREKIFDPFFTTKEVGKGTGLGLAIVYGIIKQHKGYVSVYSEPGVGTTFKMYLPLIKTEVHETVPSWTDTVIGGSETILLAEDDEAIRAMMSAILKEFGYTVLEARDGLEAVRTFKEHQNTVRLVLLDVIMPRMNGKSAADEIRKISSTAKLLFQSGYPLDRIQQKGLLRDTDYLLNKPVSPQELLKKVRLVLDK